MERSTTASLYGPTEESRSSHVLLTTLFSVRRPRVPDRQLTAIQGTLTAAVDFPSEFVIRRF